MRGIDLPRHDAPRTPVSLLILWREYTVAPAYDRPVPKSPLGDASSLGRSERADSVAQGAQLGADSLERWLRQSEKGVEGRAIVTHSPVEAGFGGGAEVGQRALENGLGDA